MRGRSRFEFVTQGLREAIRRAGLAASAAPVTVLGNAAIAREALLGDLVDELRLHLVPVLLGAGDGATHLRYRVIRHDRRRPGIRASAQS